MVSGGMQGNDEDSENEIEQNLEYIKRKEEKPTEENQLVEEKKDKEKDKDKEEKGEEKEKKKPAKEYKTAPPPKPAPEGPKKEEPLSAEEKKEKEKEEKKKKNLGQQMQAAMEEQKETTDPDAPSSFYERNYAKKSYSIWCLDFWLRDYLKDWNFIIVYILEVLIIGIILFSPSIFWLIKEWDSIEFSKYFQSPGPLKFGEIESLFRIALFTFLWYTYDLIVLILCDGFLGIMNAILIGLQLGEFEFAWGIVASIYSLRIYIRIAATCFFISFLLTKMFSPFVKPSSLDIFDMNTHKVLIFWFAIYSSLHFICKFILSLCVYDIKRSSYTEPIWDLNYKLFIFKKMSEIGEESNESNREEICNTRKPSFDPGFYLTDTDFFLSEEDAKIVANNILVSLKKKKLTYEDIKKYFPNDFEKVYCYFSELEISEENPDIMPSAFIKRAKELYTKRSDMQRTLMDRDYIFEMLESLVSLIVLYLAAIVLCMLFDIDYKLYLFGMGSSILTFTWVFADTIKKVFICFVFILLVRPYVIGDRVMILTQNLKVQKVNLFHTTFLNENKTISYMANDILFNTQIHNYARSPLQSLEIEVATDGIVTLDSARRIEEKVQAKIKESTKHFSGVEMILKTDLRIHFMVNLKKNLQDDVSLLKRKKILMKIFDQSMGEAGVSHKSSYVFKP